MSGILTLALVKDGGISVSSREVLGLARKLVAHTGGQVGTALVGAQVSPLGQALIESGADRVYVCENEKLKEFHANVYLNLLQEIAGKAQPKIILVPHETIGLDLGARLAFRLEAGLVTDCTDFEFQNGGILFIKPVYGGKALAKIRVTAPVSLVTVRSRAQEPLPPDPNRKGESFVVEPKEPMIPPETKGIEKIKEKEEEIPLEDAQVVISGGRGMGGTEAFEQLRKMAKILGGAVGASRAAVDAGWAPPSLQVGQTGKIVSPALYFAIALSGSSQHVAGMSGSKMVVAINRDPEAPVFRIANLGIVEDYRNVLPALIDELKKVLNK
jgi:electron transfer flavoprotein alpha subunit